MKIVLIILAGLVAGVVIYDERMERREIAYLNNDQITDCRPPGDQGERLIATLANSADGGPLEIHCEYHATIARAQ